MKRRTLLFLSMVVSLLGTISLSAQTWDAPSLNSEDPVSGTAYYIYNLGSEGFLNQGASWGTQAAVSPTPRANASTSIISWTAVNTEASLWSFQTTKDGALQDNDFVTYLDDAGGTIYTDQGIGWGGNSWTLAEVDEVNNIYTFQVLDTCSYYDASAYMGSELATETGNRGIGNPVKWNRTADDDYIRWIFVSAASYELYLAKVELDKYMTYAFMLGEIDLTTYIATYEADITADIITATDNLIAELAATDVSASIANASFETNDFTDWTNDGLATQGNDPNQGWIKDGTYYAERWVSSSSNLPASSLSQDLSGLDNGIYQLVVNGHAVQQGGSNPMNTGAFIICGGSSTEIGAGAEYTVDFVEVTDGTLTVGYVLEGDIACNWSGIDNFRLFYYAPSGTTDAEMVEETTAKVYPTVSTGEVTVEFADTPKAITVYSLTGSIVKQIANPSVKEVVSIDGNGVYMVKVESQTSSQLVKVIIAQ